MSEQSAFDREQIVEMTQIHGPGLLEQLQVPPATAAWMRRRQREIWAVLACLLVIFVSWALWDNHRTTRAEKGASALAAAMKEPVDTRAARLAEVISSFGGSSAATWARIEQAHLARDKGDFAAALALFEQVRGVVAEKSPLAPLVLYGMATTREQAGNNDEALSLYRQLAAFKGFAPLAWQGQGRLHEAKGEKEMAVQMYEKYLAAVPEAKLSQGIGDPSRDLVNARVRELRQ